MTDYLSVDELGTDTCEGVRVAWVGEDGDAIAFTENIKLASLAVRVLARRDLGGRQVMSEPPQMVWARFHRPDGCDPDEWQGDPCAESDEGAIRVVWVKDVTTQREAMLAERDRLLREHPEVKGAAELAPLMGEFYSEYWWWIRERSAAEDASEATARD